MPFGDRRDFTNAQRGFLGRREPGAIHAADGTVVWDNDSYAFLSGDAPETVHPSLWRQSQLNSMQGLYEVVEGIYQVRGFDLSNVTFVEGDTGVIIIDPLTCVETARAAFELYRQHRGEREVRAVIYTHSHPAGTVLPRETEPPKELPPREIVVLTAYGSLLFASAAVFEQQLPNVTSDSRVAVVVLLLLRGKEDLGSTFIQVFTRYADELHAVGGHLLLAGIGTRVLGQLSATGALDAIGRDNAFAATPKIGEALTQALDRARKLLDEGTATERE